jgi:hypothetical protein
MKLGWLGTAAGMTMSGLARKLVVPAIILLTFSPLEQFESTDAMLEVCLAERIRDVLEVGQKEAIS